MAQDSRRLLYEPSFDSVLVLGRLLLALAVFGHHRLINAERLDLSECLEGEGHESQISLVTLDHFFANVAVPKALAVQVVQKLDRKGAMHGDVVRLVEHDHLILVGQLQNRRDGIACLIVVQRRHRLLRLMRPSQY